jgi:hypothetical protein
MSEVEAFGSAPGHGNRQEYARQLICRVSERLQDHAPSDGASIGSHAIVTAMEAVRSELSEDEHIMMAGDDWTAAPYLDYKILVGQTTPGSVSLSCHYGAFSVFARLRRDGVLDEWGSSITVSLDDLNDKTHKGE